MRRKELLPAVLATVGLAMLVVALFAATASTGAQAAPRRVQAGKLLRGGTLRVNDLNSYIGTDPGLAYDPQSWSMLHTTEMLLVDFPEKNGPAGGQLYPEAATSFPTVSGDGRTYTFQIRPGLRFSDGAPVTAAAYQRAWERMLSPKMAMGSPLGASVNEQFQTVVAGGEAFLAGKSKHIAGISAKGLTLVVHLTKPNQLFLAFLDIPWFGAVKPNMPYSANGIGVYPSAGPYYIQSFEPGTSLVEARNPYYKGSRPANPDKIVWTLGTDPAQSLLQVKAGQADVDANGTPPTANAQLAQQYGINKGRFFVSSSSCLAYWALNTTRPPFNQLKYRQAVNWAIDRPALARIQGKFEAKRTDQILIPGVLGYRPYDIYAFRGADPAMARKVAGGTIPGTIVVLHTPGPRNVLDAQIVEYDLSKIGAKTKDIALPLGFYFNTLGTKGVNMDMAWTSWCVDYFDPSDLTVLIDGRTIHKTNNTDYSYFNNPAVNKQMDHAASLTGVARANAYAALDREIMSKYAPIAPFAITNGVFFVSARVHNYVFSPYFGEPDWNALTVG